MIKYLEDLLYDLKQDESLENQKQKILALETAIDILKLRRNNK